MIKIQVWADFVCPYSYIGERNLQAAIKQLNIEPVDIQFASYLQYPFVAVNNREPLTQYLSNKYSISEDEALEYVESVGEVVKQNGLVMQLEQLKPTNTFTAHRLSKLALAYKLQRRYCEKLFQAYFVDEQTLDEERVLAELAVQVGIPAEAVAKVLANSAAYESEVEQDLYEAQRLGIEGTPYFIFNDELKVAGVQSVEAFEKILQSLITK